MDYDNIKDNNGFDSTVIIGSNTQGGVRKILNNDKVLLFDIDGTLTESTKT